MTQTKVARWVLLGSMVGLWLSGGLLIWYGRDSALAWIVLVTSLLTTLVTVHVWARLANREVDRARREWEQHGHEH
jgi:hypothetical protein